MNKLDKKSLSVLIYIAFICAVGLFAPAVLAAGSNPDIKRYVRWYDQAYIPQGTFSEDPVVRINTPISAGSGVYVAPNLVLTNAHVIQDHKVVDLRSSRGSRFRGKVYKIFKDIDIALIDVGRDNQAYPIKLNRNVIRKGDNISSQGFPQGRYELAKSTGTVVDVTECCILHNSLIAAGSSGGPLFDERGELIGINALLYKSKSDRANESDLSIAISIKNILKKAGIGDFTYRYYYLPDGHVIEVFPSDMSNDEVLGIVMRDTPSVFYNRNVNGLFYFPNGSYVKIPHDMTNREAYKMLMRRDPGLFKKF